MAAGLADWMERRAGVPLADVAHTLTSPPGTVSVRRGVCGDRGQAVAGLRAVAAGQPAPGVVGPHDGPCGPGTVFVYSGSGFAVGGDGPAVARR